MSPRKPEVWPGYVLVGEVTSPFGIDGSVRVYPTTDFPERLVRLKEVAVDRLQETRSVERARLAPPMAVMKLGGVNTRNQAETLRGALLMVPEVALPPLPEGEYYWHQLIGLRVEEVGTGRVLGRIIHVIRTGASHDVFEVERAGKKPLLIPALKSVVREVDLAQDVMRVVLLPGLEDAAE
ncbi:MAG: ribosome maturation factor RimM [Firmicutes bacterium]|nr:ribosome maturation factor RimM [Bacillota bacterium]